MNVVIVDTGCANLASVKWALERMDYRPQISRCPEQIFRADKLLLPGVGTARAAMEQLQQRQLVEVIKACTQPVLGICLGMQLLGAHSEETDNVTLLGLIDEPVVKMSPGELPLPHMGWNQTTPLAGHPLFRGLDNQAWFYFVHSYAMPVCAATVAHCSYGPAFSAAVQQDNFFGVQFHPERSGPSGARLLKNFLEM